MPKISVIIPVYNVAEFLTPAIRSVLNQTFKDFEIIAIDDGSSDNSAKILASLAKEDARIRPFYQQNQGVSNTRNKALELATGEYIAFLDSDDEISPLFLETLYNALQNEKEADFAFCGFTAGETAPDWITQSTQPTTVDKPFNHFILRQKPRIDATTCPKLYRRLVLKDLTFPPEFSVGEDLIFLYQVLYRSKKAVHVPQTLYFYRTRETSAIHKPMTDKRLLDELYVTKTLYLAFKDKISETPTQKTFEKYIANRFFRCVFKMPKNDKNYSDWVAKFLPMLKEFEKQKVFLPQFLTVKNKFKYFISTLTIKG